MELPLFPPLLLVLVELPAPPELTEPFWNKIYAIFIKFLLDLKALYCSDQASITSTIAICAIEVAVRGRQAPLSVSLVQHLVVVRPEVPLAALRPPVGQFLPVAHRPLPVALAAAAGLAVPAVPESEPR